MGRRIAGLILVMFFACSRATASDQATVRLSVRSGGSIDYASGTVIDRHGSRAIIATCAHLVIETKGKIPVAVDVGGKQIYGKVLAYSEESDTCLGYAEGTPEIAPTPIAKSGFIASVGSIVTSSGCDEGGPVSSYETKVTYINRYIGYGNIEVAAIPKQGRSGGGLVLRGELIGVCSGINPVEHEGIYCSVDCVRSLWEKRGFTDPWGLVK